MKKQIIVFSSTRDAIQAERLCRVQAIACRTIPVPRDISAECGIALEMETDIVDRAKTLFSRHSITAAFHERP